MIPRLEQVEYVRDYTIRVRFSDGRGGEIDLANELWGEVFEPLKDPSLFRDFQVNTELNTVTWSSGADLAPEFLYERVSAQPGAAADRPPARR